MECLLRLQQNSKTVFPEERWGNSFVCCSSLPRSRYLSSYFRKKKFQAPVVCRCQGHYEQARKVITGNRAMTTNLYYLHLVRHLQYYTTSADPRLSLNQQLFCRAFVHGRLIVFTTGIEKSGGRTDVSFWIQGAAWHIHCPVGNEQAMHADEMHHVMAHLPIESRNRNLSVEHLSDGSRNLPLGHRLHRKGFDACRLGSVGIDQMAESGAHDDGHIRSQREDLFHKVDARHVGHSLVGNDKIEPGGVLFQK
jgi:hypothetical protein